MIKLFKNCNTIYFKNKDIFEYLNDFNVFKGKIIISDSTEISKLCFVRGIVHVFNTGYHIPNEKIDCIVCSNTRISDLESNITKNSSGLPILYFDSSKKQQYIWCGICCKIYSNDIGACISRYCSEKCMKKENGFSNIEKDLGINDIVSKILASEKDQPFIIEFDKSLSDKKKVSSVKKTTDKFQSSMIKDAVRLEYSVRREDYKKEMRKPSHRKSSLSNKKQTKSTSDIHGALCKGLTKKGKQCTNKALSGSLYCGIISHNPGSEAVYVSDSGSESESE